MREIDLEKYRGRKFVCTVQKPFLGSYRVSLDEETKTMVNADPEFPPILAPIAIENFENALVKGLWQEFPFAEHKKEG